MITHDWDRCVWNGRSPEDESFVGFPNPASAMMDACIDRQIRAYRDGSGVLLAIRERAGMIFHAEVVGPVAPQVPLPAQLAPGDFVTLPYTSIGHW